MNREDMEKVAELHMLTGGMGSGKSTLAKKLQASGGYDIVRGTDTGRAEGGVYVQPSKEEKARIRAELNKDVLAAHASGKRVLVEGFHSLHEHHAPLVAAADKIIELDTPKLVRGLSVAKRSLERNTPLLPDIRRFISELPDEERHRAAFLAHVRPGTPIERIKRDGRIVATTPMPDASPETGSTKISSDWAGHDDLRDSSRAFGYSLSELLRDAGAPGLEHQKAADLLPSIKLQDHQQDAVESARKTTGLWLLHGLGSGKTLLSQAIAEDRGGNVLVVVPASLRNNYKEQLGKFVEADRIKDYHIVSYDGLRADPGLVDRIAPNTLICDEFHRLRNAGENRTAVANARTKVPFMIGMSGTMASNHPSEIVPLVNLVAGKPVLPSMEHFNRTFLAEKEVPVSFTDKMRGMKPGVITVGKNLDELGRILRPYIHRFKGNPEWKKNVPEVKEEIVRVPMSPRQEALYKEMLAADNGLSERIKKNLPPSKQEAKSMTAFLTGLRQVLNAPETMHTGMTMADNPKLLAVVKQLQEHREKDPEHHKAVVYSNFVDSGIVPIIAHTNDRLGMPATTFTGAMNDKEKATAVADYNEGRTRVLGLSPAGAEGLDLKKTQQAHILDAHWNPERATQFIGRTARFKSHDDLPEGKRVVTVKRYMAVHAPITGIRALLGKKAPTSADEWIHERSIEKATLTKQFTDAIPHYDDPIDAKQRNAYDAADPTRAPVPAPKRSRGATAQGTKAAMETLTRALSR